MLQSSIVSASLLLPLVWGLPSGTRTSSLLVVEQGQTRLPQQLPMCTIDEALKRAAEPAQDSFNGHLSKEQHATLVRDGVLLVRNLLGGNLTELTQSVLQAAAPPRDSNGFIIEGRSYLYNPGVRAMFRNERISGTLQSAFGCGMTSVIDTSVWAFSKNAPGLDKVPMKAMDWHADMTFYHKRRAEQSGHFGLTTSMLSVWIPLTDSPNGIEFIKGSHHARDELYAACNKMYHEQLKETEEYVNRGACVSPSPCLSLGFMWVHTWPSGQICR